MSKITKAQKDVLKRVYAETVTNPSRPYGFVTEAEGAPLVTAGWLEVNTGINNGQGGFAAVVTPTGATEAGINAPAAASNPPVDPNAASTPAAPAAKPTFALVTAALPASTRVGAGRVATYPFEDMPVGVAFFIPDDGTKNFAKTKASTVSGANKRLAPKKFVTRNLTAEKAAEIFNQNGQDVTGGKAGIGVWRMADTTPAAPAPAAQ